MDSLQPRCLQDGMLADRSFHNNFDRTAFSFSHSLHESPLFRMDSLLALAERLSAFPGRYYIEEGQPHPGMGWGSRLPSASLLESLRTLKERQSLVMLKRVQAEPDYADVAEELTNELTQMTGIDMRSHYRDTVITILIASPERVTPYHIDGEANLLMQIQGMKDIYIFDGTDREILPAIEIEHFWTGDIHAATYREALQSRAWCFRLQPGIGVSNPVLFPHWVRNGPEVSISVSVNFKRRNDDVADAFRVNARMRRLGLHPMEPGKIATIDHTKGVIYRAFRDAAHALEGLGHHPDPTKPEAA
ncbi:hypothetical protein [Silvibacterium acidisoli]|uniref:hypothetical protein n=1 Tax=Acidobacteriaceae bacterium ZG23-2 TaxID=2883246 RepID=UPI00406BFCDD